MLAGLTGKHIASAGRLGSGPALGPHDSWVAGAAHGEWMTDTNVHAEIELKFLVPAATRVALAAALAGRAPPRRVTLTASYFDTPDQRLARAGLAWRMRREGGRWVQALKAAGSGALERFEHEVVRPDASPDPDAHADTVPGRQLLALLHEARQDGLDAGVRFETRVRRLARRVRTRGAVVEIALDEGRLLAGDAVQRLCEVEFELVSGSPVAMLALAERWRQRFGLVYDPRNKAERGHRLAAGAPQMPLRKAARLRYDADASVQQAWVAVVDECLTQISRNAIGLADPAGGDPALRAEHVHQLRVGIRRLRSALRAFRGWVGEGEGSEPPAELVDGLRRLFAALGQLRERDVPEPAALIRADETQRLLLAWITWRAGLEPPPEPLGSLKQLARRRLRRWHRAIVRSCQAFDTLDPAALHDLRKQVKRQRYALEFFAPLLPRKRAARHLQALAAAQQCLGEINDLVVAREHYQALVSSEPAAWFAVGWLTARLAEARVRARGELDQLAGLAPLSG